MSDGRHLAKIEKCSIMDIINIQLKTGNKTVNINAKMQFIHTVNGDGSKTTKNIKRQC